MLTATVVVVAGLLWLGILFGAALWGERRPQLLARRWGAVYALSLAVYCTSWTFYGTVTQAARSGWPMPPTFVGTILLYVFGIGVLLRLVRVAREHNSSSLADLIATRLGKSSWLAAAVTGVALLGMIPYLALQLKAVAMSYSLLTRGGEASTAPWEDSALYVALAMAVFAMLFGTRSTTAAEHNRGLVLAMAVESLLKLGAMLALGVFVWFGSGAGPVDTPLPTRVDGSDGFPALIALGVLAMFTLPHQFHVGVVECQDEKHLRTARWLFPLYMVLIALPVLPLARAGEAQLAPLGVPSDLYVLALPLAHGAEGLALLAFLGGLSAATGMVILATLSLSLMIGNHWLAPLRARGAWAQPGGPSRRGEVLFQRRFGILAVVLLAWAYSRAIAGSDALADIGALSFSALATLAPALGFALWRPQTPPRAVLAGLALAVAMWSWTLLLPSLAPLLQDPEWLRTGPFGLAWLAPDAPFGLSGWSRLLRALVLSLVSGALLTWLLALRQGSAPAAGQRGEIEVAALRELALRFLPETRVDQLFVRGISAGALEAEVERELASVFGAASAKLLLDTARREPGSGLQAVATLVGEASQALRFNQRLLEAALENMSQGISVVDRDLRLVAWNRRYAELFGFPPEMLQVGQPVESLALWALRRGYAADAAGAEAAVEKRLSHMRAGTPHLSERRFPDGNVVEIRGNPMPGGGFVATFTDVTAFRRAERDLIRANESLEQRVQDRTVALVDATAAAQRANHAKSRFLAAVSHDLAQPLNAARLFTYALGQQLEATPQRTAVDQIDGALGSAEDLLAGLLDISRLDAGGMTPHVRDFCVGDLLQHLATEFGVLAREKGLTLDHVASRAWVRSDPQLLRRVLQNFLANAVRYTRAGKVLLGCRRRGEELHIEVWDTGIGIAEGDRAAIFEEFRRLDRGGQGLGLGLSIAERIAHLLGHGITLRSEPGRGTGFVIAVPRVAPQPIEPAISMPAELSAPRSRVLVVDNDAAVLSAMRTLLETWRCEVSTAVDADAAQVAFAAQPPELLLFDFHLDAGMTGLELRDRLGTPARALPCVIITADHDPDIRAAVEAAGCLLLYKPLKPLALKAVMARVLAARSTPE